MTATKNTMAQQPKYTPRLFPAVVDEIAAFEPQCPYIYQSRSDDLKDGWAPVSFGELANAVNYVAHLIATTVKPESKDEFPTLVYMGHNDVRIGIVTLAAIKAGCQAFFISPRNTPEMQRSLFQDTNSKHIWYAESFSSAVQTWIEGRDMTCWQVPAPEEWLRAETTPFPYNKTYQEARFDPLVVLHTSGSTGTPKPIIVRQGGMAIADEYRATLQPFCGGEYFGRYWETHATRMLSLMPGFHAGGVLVNFLTGPIYFRVPIALPLPGRPLTAELAIECLVHSGADAVLMPPSILEEVSKRDGGVDALRRLNFVTFGGGNLSQDVGDRLVGHGVTLLNVIGSTESATTALYFQSDPKSWQYFIINADQMGAEWVLHDKEENIYQLVMRRKDANDPLDQQCFYTFPEATEWATGDLYKPHPTREGNWMYKGRADDVIVFSNGEKLNPVTIEAGVNGHPLLRGSLVVGQDKFQPAIFLEPYTQPASENEARKLIEEVWPLIDELNKQTVSHGRISRQLVALTDPDVPLPRTSKGSIQRVIANRMYQQRANELFQRADAVDAADVHTLDVSSQISMLESLLSLLVDKMKISHIEAHQDFFSAGMDSLQVLTLTRLLKAGFEAAGVHVSPAAIAPRAVYSNPTPRQLAKHLYASTQAIGQGETEEENRPENGTEVAAWQRLVQQYTQDLPARHGQADKPHPLDKDQTILVTGTTGSLGAYMLHLLCESPNVKSVIALNRGQDGGASRQPDINSERGLTTNLAKVTFLGCDVSKPGLGISAEAYSVLLETCDRIIHNAWPVNFNLDVSTFEPYIRGVRTLVDFAHAARKQVPLIFVSSIGSVGGWTRHEEPIPEEQLPDPNLAVMGYGLSKAAGSLILDAAAEHSGVIGASVRVGQIAGPRGEKGRWNPQEFLPSMIASSVHMGILPVDLGALDVVDWIPVEDVARSMLDLAGITQMKALDDISGYFHLVNPHRARWEDMAVAIQDVYRESIHRLVSFEEWLQALEDAASAAASAEGKLDLDVDENPAIKLLDTFRGFVQAKRAGQGHLVYETKRLVKQSRTAAEMGPVDGELMRRWCRQWNFAG
ncbi:putative NRPS-like protein biosynthetic cluster [Claviceps sp. LM218 group G6]|nr:putative NRPS-like protein biosynthetic cluster [Claviceps sp. LM218 group G6]